MRTFFPQLNALLTLLVPCAFLLLSPDSAMADDIAPDSKSAPHKTEEEFGAGIFPIQGQPLSRDVLIECALKLAAEAQASLAKEPERQREAMIRSLSRLLESVENWKQLKSRQQYLQAVLIEISSIRSIFDSLMASLDLFKRGLLQPSDYIVVHNLINVLGLVKDAIEGIESIAEVANPSFGWNENEAGRKVLSVQSIHQLLGHLQTMEAVFQSAKLTASRFGNTTTAPVKEKLVIAQVLNKLRDVLPMGVIDTHLTDLQTAEKVNLDQIGLIEAIANMRINGQEALKDNILLVESGRAFDFRVGIRIEHLEHLPSANVQIDSENGSGSKTVVFSTHVEGKTFLTISFKDNSGGIPLALLPSLFEKSVSTKSATAKEAPQRGVGLPSMLIHLADHSGWVKVLTDTSGTDSGTTFEMYYPLETPKKKITNKKRTLVIVDDSRGSSFPVKKLATNLILELQLLEVDVIEFLTRQEAIDAIADGSIGLPYIIFGDQEMPPPDRTLLEFIDFASEKNIPFYRHSGACNDPANPLPPKATGELPKPCDIRHIREILLRHIPKIEDAVNSLPQSAVHDPN